LLTAVPTAAFAEDAGFWSVWVRSAWKREGKFEIPFAVLFTIPPMIICKPVWLVNVAVAKMKGGADD